MKTICALFLLVFSECIYTQERPIQVIVEEIPNRLSLYALNENDQDFDVMITVTGTNFRQSKARPRLIRVPATSKVHLTTLMLIRGKNPKYNYDLIVNDSLSNRSLKKQFEKIKIRPNKSITIYFPKNCTSCDTLMSSLQNGKYFFTAQRLDSIPEVQEQLQGALGAGMPIDSLKTPILNIGGKLFTRIETYEEVLNALEKE